MDLKFKVNPDLDEDIKKALLLDYKVEEDGSIRSLQECTKAVHFLQIQW